MSFFNKDDMIYIEDEHSRHAKQIMICTESGSTYATFLPLDNNLYDEVPIPIYLGQYEPALLSIKGIKITEADHPELFI